MPPRVGINLCATDAFRDAIIPLVEAGVVEAVERTIDGAWVGGFGDNDQPAWVTALDELFAADGALYGHGVWFSGLSAGWQPRQDAWLERLAAECERLPYQHVSEHFGYFSAGPFERFTNLTLPRCDATIELGVERARLLAAAVGRPVGWENSGVVLSPRDATEQGAILHELLDATGGWLLLDVHNVWTQAVNVGVDPRALLDALPLDRAREIHVAGGVHARVAHGAPVYLDSHDGPVPRGAKDLLAYALPRCPAVEVVFLERRDQTFGDPDAVARYRADYLDVHRIVQEAA